MIEFEPIPKEKIDEVCGPNLPPGLYEVAEDGSLTTETPVSQVDWDKMERGLHEIVAALFRRPFTPERASTSAILLYQNEDGTPGVTIFEKKPDGDDKKD